MDSTIPLSPSAILDRRLPAIRRVGVFGSTGSIGDSALSIIAEHPDKLSVFCLVAGSNVKKIAEQAIRFRPEYVGIEDASKVDELASLFTAAGVSIPIVVGAQEIALLASHDHCDIVLASIVGISGLRSVIAAAQAGKVIALANKESLVCGGSIIKEILKKSGGLLLPVDSEHSALFQALQGNSISEISKLVLTASGGPFLNTTLEELQKVTPTQALNHPRWKMGPKVSIDSSTMFNKALELIEAHWLFDIPERCIDVVVHPQSIVHSLIEYVDGSSIAQLSHPDMRGPIAYALSYPEGRLTGAVRPLRLQEVGSLTFQELDARKFRAVAIARKVLIAGGGAGTVFNAANEAAVGAFLNGSLKYLDIVTEVERALEHFGAPACATLEGVIELDSAVRSFLNH